MTKDEMRESIIKYLKKIMPCSCIDAYKLRNLSSPDCSWCGYGEDIVEFILADRLRIVQPLVEPITCYEGQEMEIVMKAIKRTLKLSGYEG